MTVCSGGSRLASETAPALIAKKPVQILDLAFVTIVLIVGATAFFRPIWDPDTFWHLAVGKEIARQGRWVTAETFSFTSPGEPWEDSEWLFHAICYPIWDWGGDLALSIATVIMGLLILLQLWRLARLAGASGTGFCLAALTILPVLGDRVRARPDLFSLLFLGVLAELLWRQRVGAGIGGRSEGKGWGSTLRLSGYLFVLFAAWANLHGGWSYGLALLGAFIAGDLADRLMERTFNARDLLRWATVFLSVIASLLMTPYTWKIPWFPIKTLLFLGQEGLVPIQEWNRTPIAGYRGALLIISACFATALLVRKAPLCASLPALLQVCLSFLWVRYPPFGLYLLMPLFLAFSVPLSHDPWLRKIPTRAIAAALSVSLACFLAFRNAPQAVPRWDLSQMYPVTETRFLQAEKISGNILNPYEIGGFLDWYYYPLGKIFMDGRYFPFVDELSDYFKSMESVDGFRKMLDRRGVELAIHPYPKFAMHIERPGVPPRGLFHYFFPKARWAAVSYGNYGGLFIRRKPEWEGVISTHEYRAFSPDEIPYLKWALNSGEVDRVELTGEVLRYLKSSPRSPYEDKLRGMIAGHDHVKNGPG